MRRSFSVLQTHLSPDVLENIRYSQLDATDEECIAAAVWPMQALYPPFADSYNTMLTGDGAAPQDSASWLCTGSCG